jgi:hypothetical protein
LGVEVLLSWAAVDDPAAEYQVWRRTPPDRSFQETERYATVSASARLPDGTFEFIDHGPFDLLNRPCYMVGASVGGAAPNTFAGIVCIPTLPSAMSGLSVSADPGPRPDSWYVTAHGFAPGAAVIFQELTCARPPCPSNDMLDFARPTSDGRASTIIDLPPDPAGSTRTIAAYQAGWLAQQLDAAPKVVVPAAQPGAPLGHPLSTRTGVPEVDRALAAVESGDPKEVAGLFVPHDVVNPTGAHVIGVPAVSCDHEMVREQSVGFESLAVEGMGGHIYAVFRVKQVAGQWQLFSGATYGIVLVDEGGGALPLATLLTVSADGIVGVGARCGTVPVYWIRSSAGFLLAPLTRPAAPSTGFVPPPNSRSRHWPTSEAGYALLATAVLLAVTAWRQSTPR